MAFSPSTYCPYNLNQFRPFPYSTDRIILTPQAPASFGYLTPPGPHKESPYNLNQFFTFEAAYSIIAPLAPATLAAVAGNASVALSWSPVPGAIFYSIYVGLSSGGETLYLANVVPTAFTVPGLVNGVTYYFKITATNSQNEGPFSNEVAATPFTSVVTTSASIKMELFETVRGTINLAWSPLAAAGSVTYQVSVNDVIVATTPSTVRVATVTGLIVDTSYLVKIIGLVNLVPVLQSNIIAYEFGSTEIAYKTVPIVGIPPGN